MEIIRPFIDGLILLIPKKYEDARGHFSESFNQKVFNEITGKKIIFVQDNESVSRKDVLRGLHFQDPPHAQGKLVRVVQGAVLDVAVDLRKDSPTYGKWHSEVLSAENGRQFWIPEGFAHGFLTLEDDTKFLYKCTNYYTPQAEKTILWNDPVIGIDWNIFNPLISEKDKNGIIFDDLYSPF